ncbi:hypothetical protein BpHYR1_050996 [Brachionus plicatilis]|uniref:Uncharacterized protein n=1 Tax=Brachionus plicatilis TaxID=10195 RepID=A0A3M7QDF7_BRAPC|nr:hypothetical protein BpHYR1_050996 [Brachionus plicatilis]
MHDCQICGGLGHMCDHGHHGKCPLCGHICHREHACSQFGEKHICPQFQGGYTCQPHQGGFICPQYQGQYATSQYDPQVPYGGSGQIDQAAASRIQSTGAQNPMQATSESRFAQRAQSSANRRY